MSIYRTLKLIRGTDQAVDEMKKLNAFPCHGTVTSFLNFDVLFSSLRLPIPVEFALVVGIRVMYLIILTSSSLRLLVPRPPSYALRSFALLSLPYLQFQLA